MDDLESVLGSIKPGDQVSLDNSDYIAIQSYYRHQCPPDLDVHAWDQFRNPDGTPALPQRAFVMGPGFTGTGMPQDGNIQCKVINIQALMDESTCPWCADWYKKKIEQTKGSLADHRVYYMERCMHGDTDTLTNYMVVNYMGALRQSLLDVADWVEKGIEPLPSTNYILGEDGQIHPDEKIENRNGIQEMVTITANGKKCAHVKTGEKVTFTIDVQMPKDAGKVTEIVMTYAEADPVPKEELFPVTVEMEAYEKDGICGAKGTASTAYLKPGTYFAVTRVKANRKGNADDVYTQILNLDRVRIVVE
jgi:hypothetical protein